MTAKKICKIYLGMILRHCVISISSSISYCLGMFVEKISDVFGLRKINVYIKNLKMTKFHIWKLPLAKIMSLLFWKILWKIIICWIIKRVYLLSMIEYQNLYAFVHILLEILKVNMSYKNTFSSFLQLLATKSIICLSWGVERNMNNINLIKIKMRNCKFEEKQTNFDSRWSKVDIWYL